MNAVAQKEWDGDWEPRSQLHPVMAAALAPWAPPPRITSSDLYCIAMESDTAYRLMPQLCRACGIAYPPVLDDTEHQARRDALPDPLTQGETK